MDCKTQAPKVNEHLKEGVSQCKLEYAFEPGASLDEAIEKYGEKAVYAQYISGIKVSIGQWVRATMMKEVAEACPEKDLDNLKDVTDTEQQQIVNAAIEVVKAKLPDWTPEEKIPSTKGSNLAMAKKLVAKAKTPEEQEALLALIKAQIAEAQAAGAEA